MNLELQALKAVAEDEAMRTTDRNVAHTLCSVISTINDIETSRSRVRPQGVAKVREIIFRQLQVFA